MTTRNNALADTVNGYYKSELIYGPARTGPWKTVEDVELATLGWVHCTTPAACTASSTTYRPQGVEQRSSHGTGRTAARTVRRTTRQGDRKMKRMPTPKPELSTHRSDRSAHRGRDMEPSATPHRCRRHDSE